MKGLRKSYIRNGITKVLTILMAFMFVISDVAYAVFKPGDEYKDGIQDLNQEELTGQSSNLVYYDDITDYTEVGILSVLGVVTSYENQSFKPNIYMSKGDFIESIIKLLRYMSQRKDIVIFIRSLHFLARLLLKMTPQNTRKQV